VTTETTVGAVTGTEPDREAAPPEAILLRHKRSASLDAVRGLAACAIVVLHSGLDSGAVNPGSPVATVLRHFNAGVPVLFILSGYLLYMPFAQAHADGKSGPRLGGYFWRRVIRIVPAFWAALTVTAIAHPSEHLFAWPRSLVFYLYGQIYNKGDYNIAVPQAWSLDTEVVFYLMLPVAAWLIARMLARRVRWERAEAIGIGALLLVSFAWKLFFASRGGFVTDQMALAWPPVYLDAFATGMLLAAFSVWRQRGGECPAIARRMLSAPVLWTGAACILIGFAVAYPHVDDTTAELLFTGPRFLAEYLLSYYGLAVLLVAPVILDWGVPEVVHRVLRSRPLSYLGRVSYGIYLWQFLALDLLVKLGHRFDAGHWPGYIVWAVLTLAVSIVFASVSWYVVEERFLRLRSLVRT
jgi:peptidoglycan/LPS O-acetylase OafA/YrhL